MAGCQQIGAKVQRLVQQQAELDEAVAAGTGIGGAAMVILADEIVNYDPSEFFFEIDHIEGYAQLIGNPSCVPDVVGGTAGRRFAAPFSIERRRIPYPHGDPDYIITPFLEEGGG